MTVRLAHLAILLAISTLAAGIGGVLATWFIADREFREVLDEDLEKQTDLLAELVTADDSGLSGESLRALLEDVFEQDDEETLWVTVYDTRDGGYVSNFEHSIPFDGREEGSLVLHLDGHRWRGFREDEDGFVVQVMRRADLYQQVQADILEDIVLPVTIGSSVNLLLVALLIGFFLWPMTRLARELDTRSATSLEPLALNTPAREIRVLRDVLNDLMRDVGDVLQRERRFASDVAHEMRTPLTTLKLELAGDDPDLAAARSELDRLGRLVEQLLTLARLEQGQWQQRFEPVSLDGMCRTAVARFEEKFRNAGMTLKLFARPATVVGDSTLLEILVRNLLQNVLRHCTPGTEARVEVATVEGGAELRVSDTGVGLGADVRRQLARDFSRLDSKGEGMGLGLAICRRIADVHGATIAFSAREDGATGLVVRVAFHT